MSIPRIGRKPEKSVKLSADELKSLESIRNQYNSFFRFALAMKMNRASLLRIMQQGSGSEANVKKIQRKLNSLLQTA
jgi:hypothetical protein